MGQVVACARKDSASRRNSSSVRQLAAFGTIFPICTCTEEGLPVARCNMADGSDARSLAAWLSRNSILVSRQVSLATGKSVRGLQRAAHKALGPARQAEAMLLRIRGPQGEPRVIFTGELNVV
jgi:hypothetical protein